MPHFPIRSQSSWIFGVSQAPDLIVAYGVGPLQPGEVLDEIFVDLYLTSIVAVELVRVGISDKPITVANFSDSFSPVPAGFIIEFVDAVGSNVHVTIPMHRGATDRERFFAVTLDTTGVDAVTTFGVISYAISYFPEHLGLKGSGF